jgi:hypothetical protein
VNDGKVTRNVDQVDVLRGIVADLAQKIETSQRRVAADVRAQIKDEIADSVRSCVAPLSIKLDELSEKVDLARSVEAGLADELQKLKRWTIDHDQVHTELVRRDANDMDVGRIVRRYALALTISMSISISLGMVLSAVIGRALGIR